MNKRTNFIIMLFLLTAMLIITPAFADGESDPNYGILTLVPAILIIALAFTTRNVVLSLFIGILTGSVIMNKGNIFHAFLRVCDTYILGEATDSWNAALIIFIFGIGGLVSLMMKMGGMQAIAESLSKKANSAKGTLFITWLLCLIIFFEDIASNLIVGPTMRPLAEKTKVSTEKLSFVLDSTAAPVSDIAFISTWIAYEISMIKMSFEALSLEVNAYDLFVKSVPYRFYNLLAIAFVLILIFMRRDYGPMYEAERRARKTGKTVADGGHPMMSEDNESVSPKEGSKLSPYNAIIPILVLLTAVVAGLWYNGGGLNEPFTINGIRNAFGNADSSVVILWSVMFTTVLTAVMAVGQKIATINEAIDIWLSGAKGMFLTNTILILAWSSGAIMGDLGTAKYIIGFVGGSIPAMLLPLILFGFACFLAFATGTSFGTTGIMMPIAIPLVMSYTNMEVNHLVIAVIGAVTSGAVFGDHCSPISDTTIMSSMGAGADHIEHVRTQLPYAFTVAAVAALAGCTVAGFNGHPIISYVIGIAALIAIVRFIGKPVDEVEVYNSGKVKEDVV